MAAKTTMRATIKKGLAFIASQQRADGGFDGWSSADPIGFRHAHRQPTIFFTALIAQSCSQIAGGEAVGLAATDYLLRHKSTSWSWNYWQRGAARRPAHGYPDDLDDTACALAAVTHFQQAQVTGAVLGCIGQQLVATEAVTGGPYQTWLVPISQRSRWHDVDLAVNANIANLLQKIGVMPPGLHNYLQQSFAKSQLVSSYYLGTLPCLYFIARCQIDTLRPLLYEQLTAALAARPTAQSALSDGLLLAAACYAQYPSQQLQTIAARLMAKQQSGRWLASALYVEPPRDGTAHFAGSEALTTAIICEALSLYEASSTPVSSNTSKRQSSLALKTASTRAYRAAQTFSRQLAAADLRNGYQAGITALRLQDRDGQISAWAVAFGRDIRLRPNAASLLHVQLASMNGWLAYTLYDDAMDEVSIETVSRLPVAHLALRQSILEFQRALPTDVRFHQLVDDVLNTVDAANAWESYQARAVITDGLLRTQQLPDYGDYSQLAARSWGHVLASCATLRLAGKRLTSADMQLWQSFFRHFLIARQLNDDAHDWQADLRRGHLSAVVCMLLSTSNQTFPLELIIDHQLPELRQHFWQDVVLRVCSLIIEQLDAAETALAACGFLADTTRYQQVLTQLRQAVTVTLQGRSQALDFIDTFTAHSTRAEP